MLIYAITLSPFGQSGGEGDSTFLNKITFMWYLVLKSCWDETNDIKRNNILIIENKMAVKIVIVILLKWLEKLVLL